MATINTKLEMNNLLEQKVQIILKNATQRTLDLFKEEYVKRIVYDSHDPNKFYERTWEFYKSWEWTDIKRQANSFVTEMFYNYQSNMPTFNREKFIHGSKWSRPNDVRDNLMHILNKKGRSSSSFLSVYRPAAYWDAFIGGMFQGGQLKKIMDEEFLRAGFKKA